MDKVMTNIELVLETVEKELSNNDTRAAKTLMNTYLNLLDQFRYIKFDIRDKETMTSLHNQFTKLTDLVNYSHNKITNLLSKKEYKDVDNIALITQRIESAIATIKVMTRHV